MNHTLHAIEVNRLAIEEELGPFSVEVEADGRIALLTLDDHRFYASMDSHHADARLTLTDEYDMENYNG